MKVRWLNQSKEPCDYIRVSSGRVDKNKMNQLSFSCAELDVQQNRWAIMFQLSIAKDALHSHCCLVLLLDPPFFSFQSNDKCLDYFPGFFILLFHVFLNDGVIKAWQSYLTSVKSKNSEGLTNSTSSNRKDTSPIWLRTIKKGTPPQHPLLSRESSSFSKIDLASRYHIPT